MTMTSFAITLCGSMVSVAATSHGHVVSQVVRDTDVVRNCWKYLYSYSSLFTIKVATKIIITVQKN